jgi:hypothetical protein
MTKGKNQPRRGPDDIDPDCTDRIERAARTEQDEKVLAALAKAHPEHVRFSSKPGTRAPRNMPRPDTAATRSPDFDS